MTALTDPGPIDVAILTIKEEEFDALLEAFPDSLGYYVGPSKRHYNIRTAEAGPGPQKYRVSIACQTRQGNAEAQALTSDTIAELEPRLLMVVGIAGGVPSSDVSLGDVVIATRVNDYTVRKSTPSATAYAIAGGDLAEEIERGVTNLRARRAELGDWAKSASGRPVIDTSAPVFTTGNADWNRSVARGLNGRFRSHADHEPKFKAGVIGSSDEMIADPNVVAQWIETARNLLAVEMESAGAYAAARNRCPMVAIRAISDIVGLDRDQDWVPYASKVAAAFARAYLRTTPIAQATPRTATAAPTSETRLLPLCAPPLATTRHKVGREAVVFQFAITPPQAYDLPLSEVKDAVEESLVSYKHPGQYGRTFRLPAVVVRHPSGEILDDGVRWVSTPRTGIVNVSTGEQLIAYTDGRIVYQREMVRDDVDGVVFVDFGELIIDTVCLALFGTRALGRTIKAGWFKAEVLLAMPESATRVIANFHESGPKVEYWTHSPETTRRNIVSSAHLSVASHAAPASVAQEALTIINRIANRFTIPLIGPGSMMRVEATTVDEVLALVS